MQSIYMYMYMYLRIIWIVFIRFTHNNLWSHPAVEYTRIIGYHWVGYEYDPYKNFRRTTALKKNMWGDRRDIITRELFSSHVFKKA